MNYKEVTYSIFRHDKNHMNLIIDVDHTIQVLKNVVHKATKLAFPNTQIDVQSWVELNDFDKNDHVLNFSVSYIGDSLSEFDESILDATTVNLKTKNVVINDLSLVLCYKVCRQLDGNLSFYADDDNKNQFNF